MNRANFPQRKLTKQKEAKARKELYDKLTPEQKLKKLDDGGFRAGKQREKIFRKMFQDSLKENK